MTVEPARFSFDPSAVELIPDPYLIFHRLRETEPVHWSDLGYWVASRYADARAVLMDRAGDQDGALSTHELTCASTSPVPHSAKGSSSGA